MVKLTVNGREIQVEEGANLLQACLDHGIYIPNLCFMKGMEDPPASCRLCFVEIEGERKPVASCKVEVKEGMMVRTDSESARRLQRTALRLLLSVHTADCRNCPSNKKCDLQFMVRLLGVRLRPRRYDHLDRAVTVDQNNGFFHFVPSRCVLCEKCITVCRMQNNGYSLLTFAKRSFDTVVTAFGEPDSLRYSCRECKACVEICPVSALFLRDEDALQGSEER